MKKNDLILIVSTILFTFLLYKESAGINYFLFSIALCLFAGISKPHIVINRNWLFAASLTILGGFAIFYNATILSITAWCLAASYLAGVTASHNASSGTAIHYATFSFITSVGFMISDIVKRNSNRDKTKKLTINWNAVFTMATFVVIVVLVFFFIYQKANPLFKDITKFINLDFLTFQWVMFTYWGFLMMYGFIYVRYIPKIDAYETLSPQYINKEATESKPNRFLWFTMDEKVEFKSGIVLFLLLNIMILTINILDISYLWSGVKLPEGFTFAGYLHQGIYNLIFSCVLAILLILFVFRGKLNFIQGNKTLKILAYAWILQNIIISISCAYKNILYISNYALTYRRITIFVLLFLVIVGLISALIKIQKSKNIYFLYRFNSFVVIGVIVLISLFNWDKIITRYNLSNSKNPDIEYLSGLNHSGIPYLLKYLETTNNDETFHKPENEFDAFNYWVPSTTSDIIYDKTYALLQKQESRSWRSYSFSIGQTIRSIKNMYADGTLTKFVISNKDEIDISLLSEFSELKSLTLRNQHGFGSFDLAKLAGYSKLNEVKLINIKLKSIENLPEFAELKSIDLSRNNIEDFSKLSEYKDLKKVNISNNKSKNIEFLKELKEVEILSISYTNVEDLSPISNLKKLKVLHLSSMQNADFATLPGCKNLVELDLSNNSNLLSTNNISMVISNAPNLEKVYLSNTYLSSLTYFSDPVIQISRRRVAAGTPIDSKILDNLKVLDVSKNKLNNLAGINVFGGIKSLDASNNNISSLNQIKSAPGIEELHLQDNPIASLQGLESLKNLRSLHLSGFGNLNLESIKALKKIEALTLSRGKVANLEVLQQLPNLKYLDLSDANLSNLDFLAGMKSIEVLDISRYYGTDIEKVVQCESLQVLIVSSLDKKILRKLREEIPQIRIINDYEYNERDFFITKYGRFN
ncbi:MAG: DUF4173 domain-containing protein [Bacteroidetes bacterium]|nr:DUF4173 domain-containing protein [Bacteroidota bacterium]